jgi:sporulation protein YlmC with PRC-barrel domain
MKLRVMHGAALAALIISAAPMALAADLQRNTANQQGATATNPAGSDMIKPDQMRATKIVGADAYDRNNQKLGDVKDIILDKDGKVSAVVIHVGGVAGVGGKNVAVKFSEIKTSNNRLTLDRTKEQLQQAAEYQLTDRDTGAGKGPSPVHGGQAGSSVAPSK